MTSLVTLAVTFGFNLWGGYQVGLAGTEKAAQRLTQALQEHTETTFEAVDGILKSTIRHLRLLHRLNVAEQTSIRGVLAAEADSLRQIHALILYDAAGHPVNAGLLPVPQTLSIADRAFFSQHRDNPDAGVLISRPLESLVSASRVISVSRRIDGEDGSFAGVLAADVPIDALTGAFYRTLNIGPHGLVRLIRSDGIQLTHEPPKPDALGTSLAHRPLFTDQLPNSANGVFRARIGPDADDSFVAYRALASFPLVATVAVSIDDALTDWYGELRRFTAIWAICAVVILVLTLASVRDAGRRTKAEIEARQAKTILSDALESLDGGIIAYDADDRFVLMNRRMAETAPRAFVERAVPGASYEDLTWALATSGEIAAARGREADWVRDRMSGHRLPGGWREERRIGSGWRQVSERVTASGGLAILVSDITAIKETEAALRESEDRFRRMAANIPGYVFQRRVDADGQGSFLYISEGARDFYGYDPEDLMADSSIVRAAIHPEDAEAVEAGVREAIRTLAPWQADYRLIARDGAVRWVAAQARPMRMGDGSVLWDGVVVDITARKRAETDMTEAKVRAERATRAKSSFLAAMSHELRTPLNAILGFSELLSLSAMSPKLAHKAAEYAADIHSAGSHLLQLINDLLDISKTEAGKMELSESWVEIAPLVERVVHLLAGHADEGEVKLATTVDPSLPQIRADERKILQIVLNLAANAIRFTAPGGCVTLTAGLDRGGDLVLSVADTGVGIEPEDLARVLVPFAQADNHVTRQTAGTGLGLPIAKQFAALHGGSLTIASTPGVGTTVTVRLPKDRLPDPSVDAWRQAS